MRTLESSFALAFSQAARRKARHAFAGPILAVATVVGCAEPVSPVPLRGGALATAADGQKLPTALQVVHAGPSGLAGRGESPTVVFDRPLRELGNEESELTPPVSLEPAIAGSWRWLGSQAATFEPLAGFPGSTRFTIRVAPSCVATDGARLEAPFAFAFESPRIGVQNAWIDDSELRALDVRGGVRVSFTQPTTVEAVSASTTFVNDGHDVAVHVAAVRAEGGVNGKTAGLFLVTPKESFRQGSQVELAISSSLAGAEGPLPMEKEFRATFDVIGEPKLMAPPCTAREADGTCESGQQLHLSFDAPISVQELQSHLRIDPPRAVRWPTGSEARARTGTSHWIEAEFRPGETVTVTLTPGLTNTRARRLTQSIASRIVFALPTPQVGLNVSGTFLDPMTAPSPIAVRTQALADLEIFSIPLTTPAALALLNPEQDFAAKVMEPSWHSFFLHRKVAWALGDTAKRGVVEFPSPTVPSLVGARFRQADGSLRTVSHLLVPSQHMVSAHVGFEGGVVWVTDLTTATPSEGIAVAIAQLDTGREVFRGTTSRDGTLAIPKLPRLEAGLAGYAVVSYAAGGVTESITRFERGSWSYAFGVSSDTSERRALTAVLETDRDVYRPGDELALSAVLREREPWGLRTPAGHRVKLVISNDREEAIVEKNLVTSAFGTIHDRVLLPRETPTGTARIEVFDEEGTSRLPVPPLAMATVRIEHVRPAEFQVELNAQRDRFVAGDAVEVTGKGRYLFGAPMAAVPVRLFVSRVRSSSVLFDADDERAWTSGNEALRSARLDGHVIDGVVLERESVSDAQGEVALRESVPLPQFEDDERVTVEAEYKDLTGRSGAARTVLRAFSGSRRVFVRETSERVVRPKKPLVFGVRVAGLDDADRSGVPVSLRLLRFVDRTAKRVSDGGRSVHEELVREETVVATCTLQSSPKHVGCTLTPNDPGQHVVEATVVDEAGRAHRSSFAVYVSEARDSPLFAEGDARDLELVPAAKSFKPGDIAKVLVKNPWPGAMALITVEREGVRRSEVRKLGAADTVEVPIDATMVPEVHVGVHVIRAKRGLGRKAIDGDRLARVGMTTIAVENPARVLHVDVIAAGGTHEPGQALEGSLRVVDALGQPVAAEVTVSAVDEGMIVLTGHEPPDVARAIDAYRPIAQQVVEPRFHMASVAKRGPAKGLLEAFAEKGDEGGDGGDGASRKDFSPLAAFLPGIRTDADGRATFRFVLPDTLTRYRLQVLAVGEGDRYGHGRTTFEVKKPLMLRTFFPRLLRVGDDAHARVAIQSLGLSGTVLTSVDANGGIGAQISPSSDLSESSGRSLVLALSGLRPESGTITVRAMLGGARDAVTLPMAVVDPRGFDTFATFGDATGPVAESLGDVSRFDAQRSTLSVYAFGSPYVGFQSVLSGVDAYPYDCSEQLASKVLARLAFAGVQARVGSAAPVDTSSLANVVSVLASRQDYEGWIPYWSGYPGDASLSAYVLEVLTRASHDSVAVPKALLASLRRKVSSRLRDATGNERAQLLGGLVDGRGDDAGDELSQSLAGALAGAFAERASLSTTSRAHVLRAAVRLGGTEEVKRELETSVASSVRVTGVEASVLVDHGVVFGVDRELAATSIVLRALATLNPKHRLVPMLARTIVRSALGAANPNPREMALGLQALEAAAAGAPDAAASVAVRVGSVERRIPLGSAMAFGETTLRGGDLPTAGARIHLHASGSYGYRVVLRAFEKQMPTTAVDRGIHVERRYVFLKASELESYEKHQLTRRSATEGTLGDLVIIERVVVNASPLDHVVLDDPLPGAFEVIDRSIETEARFGSGASTDSQDATFDGPGHVERLPDRVRSVWVHLPAGAHRTTTLARVAFSGTFAAPPALAEAMYEPDVRGRSTGVMVRIREP
jgi:uncharacterized protein YfaS (alpha-2-macroglobulin family)